MQEENARKSAQNGLLMYNLDAKEMKCQLHIIICYDF
jgi:hypothetical protein